MEQIIFLHGVAFLLLHELDAIERQEWRFFFGWTGLGDQNAYRLFTAAHLPLFGLILASLPDTRFQVGMDIFLVLHALAHYLLRNHRLIRFNNRFSQVWIYGGAALGIIHLLLSAGR